MATNLTPWQRQQHEVEWRDHLLHSWVTGFITEANRLEAQEFRASLYKSGLIDKWRANGHR